MNKKLISEDEILSQISDVDFYNDDSFSEWDLTLLDGLDSLGDYTSIEDDSEDISDLATFISENSYLLSQEQYTAFNEMIDSNKPIHEILMEILEGKPREYKE